MPEGDTIHYAASRIRPVLEGVTPDAIETPHPRFAGIGNLWKVEACFGTAIDPWRPIVDVSDEEALALVRWARPKMQESARTGMQDSFRVVYGKSGRPCPRCASLVQQRGQWDDNRPTYWCPGCQR